MFWFETFDIKQGICHTPAFVYTGSYGEYQTGYCFVRNMSHKCKSKKPILFNYPSNGIFVNQIGLTIGKGNRGILKCTFCKNNGKS